MICLISVAMGVIRVPNGDIPFATCITPTLIGILSIAVGVIPDYRQLLEVTRVLTRNHQDVLEGYRRMVFNVLAHNRDDHVKNFAFRMTAEGGWELAPAYDLVFAPGPGGEHTMTVAGEGRAPARKHMQQIADLAGISSRDEQEIMDEVASAVATWRAHARNAGVGTKTVRRIEKALEECLARH